MYPEKTFKILRWVKEPPSCVFVNEHFTSVQDTYEKKSQFIGFWLTQYYALVFFNF